MENIHAEGRYYLGFILSHSVYIWEFLFHDQYVQNYFQHDTIKFCIEIFSVNCKISQIGWIRRKNDIVKYKAQNLHTGFRVKLWYDNFISVTFLQSVYRLIIHKQGIEDMGYHRLGSLFVEQMIGFENLVILIVWIFPLLSILLSLTADNWFRTDCVPSILSHEFSKLGVPLFSMIAG